MRELVKVQETLDQVLEYLAGNDIGLVAEHLRTNIDKSKSIVENLLIYSVVRPNLTDKHPIEGVNETMKTNNSLDDMQLKCKHEWAEVGFPKTRYERCRICNTTRAF
jgi:hypothetical protein